MYKVTILSKIKSHPNVVDYFKELPFYNKRIEKQKIKRLKFINQLVELRFFLATGRNNSKLCI